MIRIPRWLDPGSALPLMVLVAVSCSGQTDMSGGEGGAPPSSSSSPNVPDAGAIGTDSSSSSEASSSSDAGSSSSDGGQSCSCSSPCPPTQLVALANDGLEGGGVGGPLGLAIDSTSVYWTDEATDAVMKVPLGGGTPTTLVPPPILVSGVGDAAIAVDATSVYFVGDQGIMKVPLNGGTPTTVVAGLVRSYSLAVDATSVYWTDIAMGTVNRVPIDGGTPTTLAAGQGEPWGIAVDATSVYWTNSLAGTVTKVPLGGGSITLLAAGQQDPEGIAVDGTSAYWTNYGSGDVVKAPLGGGQPTTLANAGAETTGITVDATSVYWTTSGGVVMKVALAGGAPETLACSQGRPFGVAVDGTSAYWTNQGAGTVMRLTPKDAAPMDAGSIEPADAAPMDGGCGDCNGTCQEGRCVSLLGGGLGSASVVVVDSVNAYWATLGVQNGPGSVMKSPLGGGTPTTLFGQQIDVLAVAVAAGNLYWSAFPGGGNTYDGGAILSGALDGGTVSTLATGQAIAQAVAADSNYVYWNSGYIARVPIDGGPVTTLVSGAPLYPYQSSPTQIALDGTNVYFTANTTTDSGVTGTVMRVPKSGGTPQTLAFEQASENGLAIDQANVYWTNSSGDVMKEALDGGPVVSLALMQNNAVAVAVAVDATSIYWVTSGAVLKTSLDGGAVTTVSSGWQEPLTSIAVDATSVYFTTYDGDVVRVTPK